MEKQLVVFKDLGKMDYKAAWDLQEQLLQQNVKIKSGSFSSDTRDAASYFPTPDSRLTSGSLLTTHYLLFVEHPPVYTLGKSGKMENIILSEEERGKEGIAFFHTNRGGDITFHGPGQVVGYPIFDLERFYTDIGRYLRELEEVIILTLNDYGISAGRSAGETGVWIDPLHKGKERKICAMGIRCSRWITMHGFALNVNTPLRYFDGIVPCGIADKRVTSIKQELGQEVDIKEVQERLKRNFEKVFNVTIAEGQLASESIV
jgi:lipoyl(octanoyl) transferase